MLSLIKEKPECGGKEKKALELILRLLPYLLLLIASFLPFSCYFDLGANLPNGDDSLAHRLWSWDLSYGWSNGFFMVTPSHTLMGNLGLGTYLFYGPLSHFMVAFLHLILPFMSINTCWKFFTILLTFLMGSWMYMLGRKITKSDILGLTLALCLIFAPYRINCLLYRAAYPESFALSFYPLIFLGVHELGHKDYRPSAFLSCVIGVSCCLLCHPFTGMVGIIVALVYLLCCPKGFIGLFKSKRNIAFTASTIALILCLVSFYVFPMLHYLNSGLYNVSDNQLMWTNYDHLASSTLNSDQFSGFLRPYWIEYLNPTTYKLTNTHNETWLSWCLDYVYFAFFGGAGVFFACYLSKKGHPMLGASLGVGASCLALIFTQRPEMRLVVPIFSLALLLISTSEESRLSKDEFKRDEAKILKDPSFYWALIAFVVCLLLVYVGVLWKVVPSFFYTAQFAWRLWGMAMFLAVMIIGFIAMPFRKKKATAGIIALIAGISFLSCMGIIDKRFCIQTGQSGSQEPSLSLSQRTRKQGAQNEYVPQVFRDSTYVSEYPSSLYKEIRAEIYTRSDITYKWGMEDYIDPAFLEGEGSFVITSLNSPEATFQVTVNSETALVQLPQFYYEGYELRLSGESNYTVEGINVDGLVSFRLKQGTYTASLKWVGLLSYRIGVPLFFVGIAGCAAMYFVPLGIDIHKKRKEKASRI